jgi:hypothetical protein
MEREPNQEPLVFNIDGDEFLATPQNAIAFTHPTEEAQYDHVFLFNTEPDDDEEVTEGMFVWRTFIEDFDAVVEMMRDRNYTIVEQSVTENDREAYERCFTPPFVMPERLELTPRQEQRVAFLGYVLMNNHLVPDDFVGAGDLYI